MARSNQNIANQNIAKENSEMSQKLARPSRSGRSRSEYSIQTVENALRLLEEFEHEQELGVSELSRRLDLHKNNVFRLLATLEQRGYVEQSEHTDRYRLGVGCLELGHAYTRSRSLVRNGRAVLECLSAEVRETAHLAVLDEFQVVHLDGELPDQPILSALRLGARLPAHCTALGKVLLGCSSDEERAAFDRSVSAAGGLEPRSPATIVDLHKLLEHLNSVKLQGYAIDCEEYADGLCCVAAPVYDSEHRLRGALSVSGPTCRMPLERLTGELAGAVSAAAERLTRTLGG